MYNFALFFSSPVSVIVSDMKTFFIVLLADSIYIFHSQVFLYPLYRL